MVILAQFTKGFPVVVHLDLLIIGFHVVANLEIADTFSSSSDVENSNDELHTPLQKSVVLETILFRNLKVVLLKKIGQPFNISIAIFQSCTVFCPLTKKMHRGKNFLL